MHCFSNNRFSLQCNSSTIIIIRYNHQSFCREPHHTMSWHATMASILSTTRITILLDILKCVSKIHKQYFEDSYTQYTPNRVTISFVVLHASTVLTRSAQAKESARCFLKPPRDGATAPINPKHRVLAGLGVFVVPCSVIECFVGCNNFVLPCKVCVCVVFPKEHRIINE